MVDQDEGSESFGICEVEDTAGQVVTSVLWTFRGKG